MMIIGCDFHPSWQQVSWLDTETGETGEQKLVQASGDAARVKNELQHLCLNKGVQRKGKLWSQAGQQILRELPLKPWAGRRRDDLLKLMAMLDQQIEPLDEAVKGEAQRDKMARLLQTQPGVGPITALAYVLTLGDVSRFPRGKQVASYLGLIPREHSSGGRQRLGAI